MIFLKLIKVVSRNNNPKGKAYDKLALSNDRKYLSIFHTAPLEHLFVNYYNEMYTLKCVVFFFKLTLTFDINNCFPFIYRQFLDQCLQDELK